jgi:hypothetical protein
VEHVIAHTSTRRLVAGLALLALAGAGCTQTEVGTGADTGGGSTLDQVKEEGSITVGFANERPYAYQDGGELVGEAPAVHSYIFDKIGGIELDGKQSGFDSLIPSLNADRVDVVTAGMFITPERCQQADFSNPEYVATTSLLVPKGNPEGLSDYTSVAEPLQPRVAEDREVGVVGHPAVDLVADRARARVRRHARVLIDEPPVAAARLKHQRRTARAPRLEVEHNADVAEPRVLLDERAGAEQPALFPVRDEEDHVVCRPVRREHARHLEQRRNGRPVVARAARGGGVGVSRVVVGGKHHRLARAPAGARKARDDVRDLDARAGPVAAQRHAGVLHLDEQPKAREFPNEVLAHGRVVLGAQGARRACDELEVRHRPVGLKPASRRHVPRRRQRQQRPRARGDEDQRDHRQTGKRRAR